MLTATSQRTGTCEICGRTFPIPSNAPWRRFCGWRCKQAAYRRRCRGLLPRAKPRAKYFDELVVEWEQEDAARVPPPEPTTARPGSGSKVAVLAARVAAGLELWHPSDAGWV